MIRRLLVVFGCLMATPAGAQSSLEDDRQVCVDDAQKAFSEVVQSLVRSCVMTRGPDDYAQAPRPKAFAICINWERATPESTFGSGCGFASARTARNPVAVKSVAIANCAESRHAKEGRCVCEVVDVDGKLVLKFPRRDWSGGRCK